MAGAKLRLGFDDFDGDLKTVSWEVKDVSEHADYTAFNLATIELGTEIKKWSAGRNHLHDHIIQVSDAGPGSATSPAAQGKLRLIIEGEDAVTGVVYRFPIPMPNLIKADDAGSDPAWIKTGQGSNSLTVMNPAHADYTALETEFNSTVKSPEGNGVIFKRGYIEE